MMRKSVCVPEAGIKVLAHEIVPYLTPVLACMESDGYRFRPGATVTEDQASQALISVLPRERDPSVSLVKVSDFLNGHGLYRHEAYDRTFTAELDMAHGFRLLSTIGSRKYTSLRARFGLDAVRPIQEVIYDPGQVPDLRLGWESVRLTLFYLYAFVFADNQEMTGRMKPLLRLLTDAIPIGRRGASDWIFVTA
jgi:hypothetical protein